MSNRELAILVATLAHRGQLYNDEKYIEHCRRVARLTRAESDDPLDEVVAWLHDVVEDTWIDLQTINDLFGEEVARDVGAITRSKDDESYMEYIARLSLRPRATTVKKCDLLENMAQDNAKADSLRPRYIKACEYLCISQEVQ